MELLNNVKKLSMKEEKLQLSVMPIGCRLTNGKRFIPVTAKMNKMMPSNPPILARSGRVVKNV